MVECGVRYVQLICGGWDAHGDCKGNHQSQAKKIDQPIAGLITDLEQKPLVILPMANHDNNQHAPDENLRLGNLWYGVDAMAAVLTME